MFRTNNGTSRSLTLDTYVYLAVNVGTKWLITNWVTLMNAQLKQFLLGIPMTRMGISCGISFEIKLVYHGMSLSMKMAIVAQSSFVTLKIW